MTSTTYKYTGFISYRHGEEDNLAADIQRALHRLGKPWYRLRALRLYRDRTNLPATPALWGSIEAALATSEYFLLLASPAVAASKNVGKEVSWWLKNRGVRNMLLLVAAGEIAWDEEHKDFDWLRTTCLPDQLRGAFDEEPLWIDFRRALAGGRSSLDHAPFRQAVLDVAAPLHGREKDAIDGEDVTQRRRAVTAAAIGGGLLTVLAIGLLGTGYFLIQKRAEAERERFSSITEALAGEAVRESELSLGQEDSLSALLARRAFIFSQRHNISPSLADAALRKVLLKPYRSRAFFGHSRIVRSLAFTPDGEYLFSADVGGELRRWALVAGGKDRVVLKVQTGINALAITPDGGALAAGGARVIYWLDLRRLDSEPQPVPTPASDLAIRSLSISPDGRTMAAGTYDGKVQLWSLVTDKPALVRTLSTRRKDLEIASLAFHPQRPNLVAAANHVSAWLWNLAEADSVTPIAPAEGSVDLVAFSSDGRYLAFGNFDKLLIVNPEHPADVVARLYQEKKGDPPALIDSVALSPKGHVLAAAVDQGVWLWNLDDLKSPRLLLRGHRAPVNVVAFSPGGQNLASGSGGTPDIKEYAVRVWSLAVGTATPTLVETGDGQIVRTLAFSGDSRTVGYGSTSVRLAPAARPSASTVVARLDRDLVNCGVFHPQRPIFATAHSDGKVRLWDTSNPGQLLQELIGGADPVISLAFNRVGSLLAAGMKDGLIKVWDMDKPADPPKQFRGHQSTVMSLAFGSNGRLLSGSADTTVRLWDVAVPDGAPVIFRGHSAAVMSVAFRRDGLTFASGSVDRTVRLWAVGHANSIDVLRGHENAVMGVAFSADDSALATVVVDGALRIWSVNNIHRAPIVLQSDTDGLVSVAFSPDGKRLAAGGGGKVQFWLTTSALADAVCLETGRDLTPEEWSRFIGSDIEYEATCPR